jgi:Uma2 family endonuclease
MNQQVTIDRASATRLDERLFTVSEFARMIECGAFEDMRVELVDGVLERMSPATGNHAQPHADVNGQLWMAYRGSDFFVAAELAVRTGDLKVRGIDVAVVKNSAPRDAIVDAVDLILAVEVAHSTQTRDLNEKLPEYALAGIPEYWVVDTKARVVHVMRDLADGAYRERRIIPFGTSITPPQTNGEFIVT